MLSAVTGRDANALKAFVGIFFLLILAYAPVWLSNFIIWDDFIIAGWNHHLLNDPCNGLNLQFGRFGASLLNPLQHVLLYISTAAYLRLAGLSLLALLLTMQFRFMRSLDYPPLPSFIFSIICGLLPPFYACILVVNDQHILVADILASLAAILIIRGSTRVETLGGFFLLVGAETTYTTGAAYFLVLIAIYLFSPSLKLDGSAVRKCIRLILLWIMACVVWYGGTLLFLKIAHIPRSSIPGRDLTFNHDVLGQLWFYCYRVFPVSLDLWFIKVSYKDDFTNWQIVSVACACLSICGAMYLLKEKESGQGESLFAIGATGVLAMLTVAPLLAPNPGRVMPGYAITGHATLLFFFVFWGIERLARPLSPLAKGIMRAGIVIIPMAITAWILREYDVAPAVAEQAYVVRQIQQIDNTRNWRIVVIPDKDRPSLVPTPAGERWGMRAWAMQLVVEELKESKHISSLRIIDQDHFAWDKGEGVLSSSASPNGHDVVIDMSKVPTLESGDYVSRALGRLL